MRRGGSRTIQEMHSTQKDKIKSLLLSRPNEWVPLNDILLLGVAQYNARILDLRRGGMRIENMIKEVNGTRYSWYRYVPDAERQMSFV